MRTSSVSPLLLLSLTAAVSLGCGDDEAEAPRDAGVTSEAAPPEGAVDAGVDAGQDAGPPRPPARIFARRFVSKIRERPDRDAFRVGYLRAGAVLTATTGHPVRADDPRCRGGWYELTTGGFVCNGRDVIAFWGRRLPEVRGAQPDRSAPLPYEYGRNRGNDIPMYRRLPTDEEAAEFEGYRIPGQPPPEAAEGAEGAEPGAPGEGATDPTTPPPPTEPIGQTTPTAPTAEATGPAAPSPGAQGADGAEEGDPVGEEEVVTLDSLRGERDSVLGRRLVNGFIVSLDRDFRAGPHNRRYWRTINNGFVPYRTMAPVTYPEFRGVRLDDLTRLPIGYILGRNDTFYLRSDDGRVSRGRAVDFQTRLDIVGEESVGDTTYFISSDGRYYRDRDVRRIQPRARPRQVGEHDKWIEVSLTDQYLIAYEGDLPVYVTLISSGRAFHPDDPEANFLTPTGVYRVRAKHLAATMDGDTAADGPYSIDDVPWVMYFELAYALHGAFWHRAFGFPRSHGCVNLAPLDAQRLFWWTSPRMPAGWTAVLPGAHDPGTVVRVR